MNDENVYESEEEEGLTLSKIGHFFKRGWVNMLVSIVLCVVVALAVALPIKYFYKSEAKGYTSIEFVYRGIDSGLDPQGGRMNTSNIISASVLSEAVTSAGLNGKIKNVSDLRAVMRIESVESKAHADLVAAAANGDVNAQAQLRDEPYYPSQFRIVIAEPEKLGLNDAQTKVLLDAIVTSYLEDFKTRFSVFDLFTTDLYTLSDSTSVLEFTDIYDTYVSSLTPIIEYVQNLREESKGYTSTKFDKSFDGLIADITNLINNQYNQFNSFIVTNNVWIDKALGKASLQENIKRLNYEIEHLETNIASLKLQIKDYTPNSTTTTSTDGGQTVSNSYGKEYEQLQVELSKKNNELMTKNNDLSKMQLRLEKIEGEGATDAALIERARASLKSLEKLTVDLVDAVNNTVVDYYDTTFVIDSVRQVQPPAVVRDTLSFAIWVVLLVAVLGGFIIGCILTGIFMARAKAKAKALAASELSGETTASGEPDGEEKQVSDENLK